MSFGSYNTCIEFQGKHHYEPNFNKLKEKAWNKFKIVIKHDNLKRDYCSKNCINLIEIPYWDEKHVEDIVLKLINYNHSYNI